VFIHSLCTALWASIKVLGLLFDQNNAIYHSWYTKKPALFIESSLNYISSYVVIQQKSWCMEVNSLSSALICAIKSQILSIILKRLFQNKFDLSLLVLPPVEPVDETDCMNKAFTSGELKAALKRLKRN
jgi:predicted ferric reductase